MPPRQTRSMTGALVKKAIAKTSARTKASESSPPTKRQKTKKVEDIVATIHSESPTKRSQQDVNVAKYPTAPMSPDLNKPFRIVASSGIALEFPVAADAPCKLYYGEDAPYPRWRTLLNKLPLGKDLEKDMIRTHPGRTHIPGVAPGSHPRVNDYAIGLGALKWSFEPGPQTGWAGLTGQELYTHAYSRLLEALDCPFSRGQLREAIRKGENAHYIAYVEDPLPPPPRLDSVGTTPALEGTFNRIGDSANRLKNKYIMFPGPNRYARPELYYRPGVASTKWEGDVGRLFSTLKRNRKGTFGPPDQQDISFDPVAVPNVKATKKRALAKRAKAVKKLATKGAKKQVLKVARKQAHKGAEVLDIRSEQTTIGIPPALHRQTREPSEAESAAEGEGNITEIEQPLSDIEMVESVHEAHAQHRGPGKKEKQPVPVQAHAPGSSQTAGGAGDEISKILFPPLESDEAANYIRMCNAILEDPEARHKHYPKVEAFRRIRSWAGAVVPEGVESYVKANASKVPTAHRPFRNMRRPREVSNDK